MTPERQVFYQIADWDVYPDRLLLKSGEKEVHVHDKNMQVLLTLIRANGEVVTKDQFFSEVWKDTVVTESSLNRAISELRKILDSNEGEESQIQTISKKGYRLTKKPKIKTIRSNKSRKALFLGFLVLVAGLTVSAYFIERSEKKLLVTLSPDGQKVVYFKKEALHYTLFLEDFSTQSIVTLDEGLSPESLAIAWSPDSDNVIFNATEESKPYYSIKICSAAEEEPVFISFAKDDYLHQTHSVPKDLDKPIQSVEFREYSMNENKIHHIFLNEQDTIKVLFEDKLITSFGW